MFFHLGNAFSPCLVISSWRVRGGRTVGSGGWAGGDGGSGGSGSRGAGSGWNPGGAWLSQRYGQQLPVEIQPPRILNDELGAHRCSGPVFSSICGNIL